MFLIHLFWDFDARAGLEVKKKSRDALVKSDARAYEKQSSFFLALLEATTMRFDQKKTVAWFLYGYHLRNEFNSTDCCLYIDIHYNHCNTESHIFYKLNRTILDNMIRKLTTSPAHQHYCCLTALNKRQLLYIPSIYIPYILWVFFYK